MSTIKDHSDRRVKATLRILQDNPKLKLPQAMRAAEFTLQESQSQKCQQWVRRRMRQQTPTQIAISKTASSTVSTLSITPSFKRKVKQVRHTSSATQQKRQNKLVQQGHYKTAYKMATNMYKNEKDKPAGSSDKLSAVSVSKLVEEQTKIRVAPRSILQAVKDGRAGLSPLKQGRPSLIPELSKSR
jgi:hypothetical protein